MTHTFLHQVHINGSPFAPVVVVSEHNKDSAGGKDAAGSSSATQMADELAAMADKLAAQAAASDEQAAAGFDEHSAMSQGNNCCLAAF
jgi:hypothetical protein